MIYYSTEHIVTYHEGDLFLLTCNACKLLHGWKRSCELTGWRKDRKFLCEAKAPTWARDLTDQEWHCMKVITYPTAMTLGIALIRLQEGCVTTLPTKTNLRERDSKRERDKRHLLIWSLAVVQIILDYMYSELTALSPHLVPVITSPGSSVSPIPSSPLPGR